MAKVARYELDFSKSNFKIPEVVSDMVSVNFSYDSDNKAYKVTADGMIDIDLKVEKNDKIDVIIEAFSHDSKCKMFAHIFNGEEVTIEFNPESEMAVIQLSGFVKKDKNFSISIHDDNNSDPEKSFYVKKIVFSYNMSGAWMSKLSDETLIGDVNIPGTHDSAAINQITKTPSACHYRTITEQLLNGVRLLDIRLKVKKENDVWYYVCCHGSLPGNEYQSLDSVFKEIEEWRKMYKSAFSKETLIMIFKIDDWNGTSDKDQPKVKEDLDNLLTDYKCIPFSNTTLKSVRGKILTFNRLSYTGTGLGLPIGWTDKTEGEEKSTGGYTYYAQDCYEPGNEENKWGYVYKAMECAQQEKYNFVINFASGYKAYIIGIYVDKHIINYLGQLGNNARNKRWGWLLFDYEDKQFMPTEKSVPPVDIVSLIVDTNFPENEARYKGKFSIND